MYLDTLEHQYTPVYYVGGSEWVLGGRRRDGGLVVEMCSEFCCPVGVSKSSGDLWRFEMGLSASLLRARQFWLSTEPMDVVWLYSEERILLKHPVANRP